MKGKTGPVSEYLRPILDTYKDSAVALVGCTSKGIERYSCEFDVLVVGERQPPASLKIKDVFIDVVFVPEKEILKPQIPEHMISLGLAKPVRDTSLILSTGIATSAATLGNSAVTASRIRLTSALKTLSRADEALAKGAVVDADFWLIASAYEFAYALLLSKEKLPSPSHLLSELRVASSGTGRSFEGFSMGAGLEAASRAGCGARLEGVAVLHDLLRESAKSISSDSEWSSTRTDILTSKAQELITRVELAECYSYLGQELVDAMLLLQRLRPKESFNSLIAGNDPLLGERLVRQLGLARSEKSIRLGLELLRRQMAHLAKT